MIQANFEKLLPMADVDLEKEEGSVEKFAGEGSHMPVTPPNQNSATSVKNNQVATGRVVGTSTLHDFQGKEVNLDGTPKNSIHASPFWQSNNSE